MPAMKDYIPYIQQKFAEKSDIDTRQGSMVMDLAIKPLGLFSQGSSDEIERLKFISNIANYANMTNEEMDSWAAKFFVSRIIGNRIYGSVTIYFINAVGFTLLKDSAQFTASDGSIFVPISDYTVSSQALSSQKDSQGRYFWDINVVSTNNVNSQGLDAGSITVLDGISFIFASVRNNSPLSSAAKDETNQEFFSRLLNSVNDRSFYSRRSIYGRLSEQFLFVRSADVVGAGDSRMSRDLIQAIDPNEPQRDTNYFGKYPGAEFVPSIAFFNFFPLNALDLNNIDSPFSPITTAQIPSSISARDLSINADPADRGFPVDKEFTYELYSGIYKRETRAFAPIQTSLLYSITDNPTFGRLQPDATWKIGVDGGLIGNYGTSDKSKIDYFEADPSRVMMFKSANLSGGFTVQKNIGKRTGVMATGKFKIPSQVDSAESNPLMFFLFAGLNQNLGAPGEVLNAFSGIGFAIRKGFASDPNYMNLFIVNNNKDSSMGFYGSDNTLGGDYGWALEQANWDGLQNPSDGSDVTGSFELTLLEDLTVAVTLWNDATGASKTLLSTKLLSVKSEISQKTNLMYGQDFKISMDFLPDNINGSQVIWSVTELIIADMVQQKPMALFEMDVTNFGTMAEIELSVRASSIDDHNNTTLGFDAFIWDAEANQFEGADVSDPRVTGAWEHIDALSVKSVASADFVYLRTTIQNLDRFIYKTDIQKVIYILLVPSGKSKVMTRFSSGNNPQVTQAYIHIDFIRIFDESYGMYHAKNKSDVYVTTIRNNDSNLVTTETYLVSGTGVISLDTAKKPILSVDAITTLDGVQLGDSEFTVVFENNAYNNSAKERVKILVPDYVNSDLQVTYTYYANVKAVQDFFDSEENQGTVGDILIKHRAPVFLDFTMNYTGDIDPGSLQIQINDWFDDNVKYEINIYDLITFVKSIGVTDVHLPLTISYELIDPLGQSQTGFFADRMSIDSLQFFRLRNTVFNQG